MNCAAASCRRMHILIAVLVWTIVAASVAAQPQKLVPGFGEVETVPGFGELEATLEELYDERTLRSVEDVFRRYDTNGNDVLDVDEMGRVPWQDDPRPDDVNGDGRLTKREYAERAVRRSGGRGRLDPSQPRDADRNERESSRSSRDGPQGQDNEADRLLSFYSALDTDKDGQLEPEEIAKSPYRPVIEQRIREAGMDPRRPVRLGSFMEARLKNAGIDPGEAKGKQGNSARIFRFLERKPPGGRKPVELPRDRAEWFALLDVNQDGQVAMAEFASEWSDAVADEFVRLDENSDGFLSRQEAASLAAE